MLRRRSAPRLVVLVVGLAACGGAAHNTELHGVPQTSASRTCQFGVDGLRIVIGGLGCPPTAWDADIEVYADDAGDPADGRTFTFGVGGEDQGTANVCSSDDLGSCSDARSGSVTIHSFTDGEEVKGHYALDLADGSSLEDDFDAIWCVADDECR